MDKVMRVFVLEDEIEFYPRCGIRESLKGHELTCAKSFREAKLLYAPPYDLLLLDHDMEGRYEQSTHPNTGWRFCEWLVNKGFSAVPTILHSQNEVGRTNQYALLKQFGWTQVEHYYFGPRYLTHLRQTYGLKIGG